MGFFRKKIVETAKVEIEIPKGVSAINLQDLARFERADGSMDLDFDNTFSGTIYAVAKWAGVR